MFFGVHPVSASCGIKRDWWAGREKSGAVCHQSAFDQMIELIEHGNWWARHERNPGLYATSQQTNIGCVSRPGAREPKARGESIPRCANLLRFSHCRRHPPPHPITTH